MTTETPNGFCYGYEVKETPDKGMGVFATETIKKGSVVWRHVPGNYTVYDESHFKAVINAMTHDEVAYELTHMFGLQELPNCIIRVHDAGALMNHSSKPTLATNNTAPNPNTLDISSPDYIRDVTALLRTDRYALVATRDIEAGEEFTNDYAAECHEPDWFNAVYEQYGFDDSYMEAR
jgi:hypothetical protein